MGNASQLRKSIFCSLAQIYGGVFLCKRYSELLVFCSLPAVSGHGRPKKAARAQAAHLVFLRHTLMYTPPMPYPVVKEKIHGLRTETDASDDYQTISFFPAQPPFWIQNREPLLNNPHPKEPFAPLPVFPLKF